MAPKPIIPLNPDLPTSYQVPGIYGAISLLGTGPSSGNNRVHFVGYKTSAGTWPPGTPVRCNSETEAVQGGGKGSECHRWWRALQSHGAPGAEVWITPMNAPSGTAQTRLIKIMQARAAGALGTGNTGAVDAGIVSVWIEGYRADVLVALGDTYATIAANLLAELLKIEDFVGFTFTRSTDTITATARHTALSSADSPFIISFSNTSMALGASCGTLTFATAAVADGSAILFCSDLSAASAIANGDTANTIAANHISAVNLQNGFSLGAAQTAPSAVVTLFYNDACEVNWLATSITTATTTTITTAWGANAAGLPSSSTPSLSTALDNIKALTDQTGAFGLWCTSFTGQGSFITTAGVTQAGSTSDYSVLGTLSTFLEQQGNGRFCKGQRLVFADTRGLTTAGATQSSTTPKLEASPRYFPCYIPASPQQGYEIAARVAALIVSQDFLPQNYAGAVITTDSKVPLLGVRAARAMSDSDANSAMVSYHMTPIRMNSAGQYGIVSGRTSAKPGADIDVRYQWWGEILTTDYFRDDLRYYLGGLLKGKSIKRYSEPRTSKTITPEAVRDLVFGRMLTWDGMDFFDGAEALKDYVAAGVNATLPSRIDVALPTRKPVPLEIVSEYLFNVA